MNAVRRERLWTAIAGLLVATGALAQPPFALDTSFRASFNTWLVVSALPLPDGKVLVAGQMHYPGAQIPTQHAGLARLNADGSWDSDFPWSSLGQGKMVPWEDRFYIASTQTVRRVMYSGENDPTFIGMNTGPYFSSLQGGDYHVFPDGRLVMTGYHSLNDTVRGFVGFHNFIWFTDQGYLDTTRVHRSGNGLLSTLEQLPDGKFLASGSCTLYDGLPTSWIQRMHPDGSLDTTFFTGVGWGQAHDFLPLDDGRVYAGGLFRLNGSEQTYYLVRFLADGSLDPTFNSVLDFDQGALSGLDAIVFDVHQLAENRLLVMGRFQAIDGEPRYGMAVVDEDGNLLDLAPGTGCGPYTYQGFTYGTISGAVPVGEDQLLVFGAYHGYDDGVVNDPQQRFVSRLTVGDLSVGVQEPQPAGYTLRLYPNPTQNWVAVTYVLAEGHGTQAHVQVRDGLGRTMETRSLPGTEGQVVLDTRQWAKGPYTVVFTLEGEVVHSTKLIVQ